MAVEQVEQGVAAEDIDPHRGQEGLPFGLLSRKAESGGVDPHRLEISPLGLLAELADLACGIGTHQAEPFGLGAVHRQGPHCELGAGVDVVLHELAVVHAVELITGEDQVVIHIPFLEQPLVLAHRIGGAFEPAGAVGSLLGGEHLHEPLAETGGEVVGHREMTIEGGAVELRQHIDLVDLGVDAVADGNINQSVLAGKRHGRLGTHLGEWIQAGASTPSKDDGQNALHFFLSMASNLRSVIGVTLPPRGG